MPEIIYMREYPKNPVGSHGSETMGAGVFSPTGKTSNTQFLMVQAITQNAIFTLDGSTPSATNGFLLLTTQAPFYIPIGTNTTPKFLRAASGTILQWQWIE